MMPSSPSAPQPQPGAMPQSAPMSPSGGPTANLHDGSQLHFLPGTTPEQMDVGVHHHLQGVAKGKQSSDGGHQAQTLALQTAMLALVQATNQKLDLVAQLLQQMSGRTAGAINASTQAIVQAMAALKGLSAQTAPVAAPIPAPVPAPTAGVPAGPAFSTQ